MVKHIKILGIVHIVHSLLGVVAGVTILTLVSAVGLFSGNPGAAGLLAVVGGVIALLLLILAAPGLIGGVGLLMWKPWARVLVLVLGFLNLLQVPLGTVLGIYTLWVLLHDETLEVFEHEHEAIRGY